MSEPVKDAAGDGVVDTSSAADAPAAPVLRVVNPDATPEEIAALVAIFSALGGGEGQAPRQPRPEWSSPERSARRTANASPVHGLGGWRSSGLPR
ncbi:acyl-CoA carboxylase subunit epsilon [Nocardioides gilvus]|uniref:acyl-CoA carboxylase subunit epsilon n=1 Tax=Nocardioides gilvus TaxID=1735589 RepID=UPI001951141E|nr:acyl-CoA carboxylase subunit epsilon [Nocardioides gilvus]